MRLAHILIVLAISSMACKSGQQMTAVEPPPPPPVNRNVVERPEPENEPEEIPVVEESFDFELKEDEVSHDINRFFVILGSFSVKQNADRFKSRLENEGYSPVILLSETGYNRVCVDSYSLEADARQRVLQIRRSSPEFHDAWLLIRR